MPVGTPGNDTLVKFLRLWDEPIVWRVIGRDLEGMPAGSVTLLTDKVIALRCFDAKEPQNPDSRRRDGGNSDWGVSNLRQWANSAAPAGEWYSPQHEYDAPPSTSNIDQILKIPINPYESDPGMLYESTQQERDLVLTTDRVYGGRSGNGTTCKDKLFLLTTNELGFEIIANNGAEITYFSDGNSRTTQCTPQCIAHSNWVSNPEPTDTWSYWAATSHYGDTISVDGVIRGVLSNFVAYSGSIGVRPACNIPSDVLLSPPDADGCYTLLT